MSVRSKTDSSSKTDVIEEIKKHLGQDVDVGLLQVRELSSSIDVSFETHVLVIPSELSQKLGRKAADYLNTPKGAIPDLAEMMQFVPFRSSHQRILIINPC